MFKETNEIHSFTDAKGTLVWYMRRICIVGTQVIAQYIHLPAYQPPQ